MTDFYEILEVEKTATEDEIKKAYVICRDNNHLIKLYIYILFIDIVD